MKLGKSEGGKTNATVKPWEVTWDDLEQSLSKPSIGIKDGSYFTVGAFKSHHRSAKNLIYPVFVFVLDGDSTFFPETGEIIVGAPPPEDVSEALTDLDINHLIYTSHFIIF